MNKATVVPAGADADEMNRLHGEAYGVDWAYPSVGAGMTTEQQESFKQAALPLIKWLCENVHPHHSVIVTPTNAELLEGQRTTGQVLDFVRD